MDDARAALDKLIRDGGEDYASLSRFIGRNAAYVQQFIRRGVPKKLDEADRRKLARYFGVDESVLGGPAAPPAPANDTDMTVVPRFAIGASAGPGTTPDDDRTGGHFAFSGRTLRDLSASPNEVSAIKVVGDSMAPTLGDGDDIMVDTADGASRLRDGIYVLRFDDALNVKRIARNPVDRSLTVKSDNPAWPTWENVDPARIDIIGRVIWAGRRVR